MSSHCFKTEELTNDVNSPKPIVLISNKRFQVKLRVGCVRCYCKGGKMKQNRKPTIQISAVFSLDEQLVGSDESLQTLEVEEFLEQIDRKETRALSIHTPLEQIEKTRSYSSGLIPLDAGERKETKALSMLAPDLPDRRYVRGLSQPQNEDIEEKIGGNSKSFIRMRSKKNSQISKESGVLEKKNDMHKSQVLSKDMFFLKIVFFIIGFVWGFRSGI